MKERTERPSADGKLWGRILAAMRPENELTPSKARRMRTVRGPRPPETHAAKVARTRRKAINDNADALLANRRRKELNLAASTVQRRQFTRKAEAVKTEAKATGAQPDPANRWPHTVAWTKLTGAARFKYFRAHRKDLIREMSDRDRVERERRWEAANVVAKR